MARFGGEANKRKWMSKHPPKDCLQTVLTAGCWPELCAAYTQQTQDIVSLFYQCWAGVVDGGPTRTNPANKCRLNAGELCRR